MYFSQLDDESPSPESSPGKMGTLTKDASTGVSIQDHLRFSGIADEEAGLHAEPQKVNSKPQINFVILLNLKP
jgi:hypothetical protein